MGTGDHLKVIFPSTKYKSNLDLEVNVDLYNSNVILWLHVT